MLTSSPLDSTFTAMALTGNVCFAHWLCKNRQRCCATSYSPTSCLLAATAFHHDSHAYGAKGVKEDFTMVCRI